MVCANLLAVIYEKPLNFSKELFFGSHSLYNSRFILHNVTH